MASIPDVSAGATAVEDHSTAAEDGTVVQDEEQLRRSLEFSRQHPTPPAVAPGYSVMRLLGDGAYGSVWLAEQHNTGKLVAVKFYTHRGGLDWSLLNREVEKLAVLYTSRNIVGLLDVGWDSDPPYYVMEYLENGSLAAALAEGPLPADDAVRIARSVLQALVHAHGSGILHCDLKPANVLLDADRSPRLCDFGQSRLSDEQDPALGTLFYMAPEQASLNAVPDARWDVYALGALLYHMLCGTPPYRTRENEQRIRSAGSLEERLAAYRRALKESPKQVGHRKMPRVDRQLADIVDRCLALDPDKRFPNAQAVLDALESRERRLTRRPLVALGFVGPLLLLAAMAFLVWDVMQTAVSHARRSVTERALESDSLSARILAQGLHRELDLRQAQMVELANDPRLRDAIRGSAGKSWEEREPEFRFLDDVKAQTDAQREQLGLSKDTSWFVVDNVGKQLWRRRYNKNTVDHNYAWRHYFHGQPAGDYAPGGDVAPPTGGLDPHPEPFISFPFRSQATNQFMIAIRAPVKDEDGREVVGVLARTMHLGDLLADYAKNIRGDSGEVTRHIALADVQRGRWLLDHPWLNATGDEMRAIPDQVFEKLRLSEAVAFRLEESISDATPAGIVRFDDYTDPVGEVDAEYTGQWLAAFAPVGDTGWYAIVQERKLAAGAPVDDMRAGLARYGLAALGISCGLILLLWYFVQRELSESSPRVTPQFEREERERRSLST